MWKGSSQAQEKFIEWAGCFTMTLMMPPTEKTVTAMYSTNTMTHWALVVHRMP